MLGKVVRNHSMKHAGALHTPVDQNADSERGIEAFNRAGTINSAQWPCKGQPKVDVAQHQKLLQCQAAPLMHMYSHVGSR